MTGQSVVGNGQWGEEAPPLFGDLSLRLLTPAFTTIEHALATEEAVLATVDAGESPATLLFWEWSSPAVIVGRSNQIHREVCVDACDRHGVPILRRCSGGGTVVLGRGCLCYALVLPVTPHHRALGISTVTRAIMQQTANGFVAAGFDVCVDGISDLVVGNHKFSGNSQRWQKNALLHHGTILYDFDLAQIDRYLQFPSRQPDYRADRHHHEFVTNLPATKSMVVSTLTSTWHASAGTAVPSELTRADELLRTRYHDAAWHRGR
ncbi:MAG TPA: lipoate--protein ligase family protein [Planctomycetaceae bacterium]|nr:lipoate--protein ligase family protein [Planctomycetaceae bacterium]